ncbi:MAG: FIST N-terminal domain-containing protein [Halobacteriota archaeon]
MILSKVEKVVICLAVIAIVVGSIGVSYILKERGEEAEALLPELPGEQLREGTLIRVGSGWSVKSNERAAVEEALSSARAQLKGKSPEFVILFSTVGYDSDKVLGEVRSLLGDVQVYGGTSCLSVQNNDGLHVGERGSLALLAVSSENITFGVGGVSIGDYSSARDAGKAAILTAIDAAEKVEGETPKIVLMTAAPGEEEEVLAGIEEVIGNDVPVFGGSSGDNDITGKWKQFANDRVYSNGISLTAIYTDLKVGWALEAGYERSEYRGTITRAEGRTIYEIDNQPAAEVYNTWTGGSVVAEELETGGSVLSKATFYPLAKVLKNGGEEYTISIHPLSINATDHSLEVFANVDKGDEVMLMHGDWELLLNRALSTPTKALESESLSEVDISFAIYDFCAGTMLAIPEDERPKMFALVKTAIGDAPFIGTFTFGEQGHIRGAGNYHNNLVNWMVVFTEEKE